MRKTPVNENVFGAVKKFTDSFFDALKNNTAHSVLSKVEKNNKVPSPIIQKMKEIDKLSKELDNIIKKYARVDLALRPDGFPQERVWNVFYYLNQFGLMRLVL